MGGQGAGGRRRSQDPARGGRLCLPLPAAALGAPSPVLPAPGSRCPPATPEKVEGRWGGLHSECPRGEAFCPALRQGQASLGPHVPWSLPVSPTRAPP